MRRPRRTRPRPPKTPWSEPSRSFRLRHAVLALPDEQRLFVTARYWACLPVARDRPGGRYLPGGNPQAAAPRARRARRNPRTEILMNPKKRIDLENRLSSCPPVPPPPEDLTAGGSAKRSRRSRAFPVQEAARGFHARLGARGRDGGADRCGDLARLPGQPCADEGAAARDRRFPAPHAPAGVHRCKSERGCSLLERDCRAALCDAGPPPCRGPRRWKDSSPTRWGARCRASRSR